MSRDTWPAGFLAVHAIVGEVCAGDPDGWGLCERATRCPWGWAEAIDDGWTPEEVVSLALDGAPVCDADAADEHLARITQRAEGPGRT